MDGLFANVPENEMGVPTGIGHTPLDALTVSELAAAASFESVIDVGSELYGPDRNVTVPPTLKLQIEPTLNRIPPVGTMRRSRT